MNRVTTALATAFQENEMNRYRRFQLRTLAATLMLVIALAAVAAPPAQAQNSITLFLQTQYARSSFGRQVSFTMEPVYATGNQLTGATLVVNLPHGVSFVSADPDSFDGVTVASVTGSSASGVQVTLNIGQARSNFLVLSNILTVSIDNAVADGTILQATFELSGTLSSTGATADSGAVSIQFQVGYLPLSSLLLVTALSCLPRARPSKWATSPGRPLWYVSRALPAVPQRPAALRSSRSLTCPPGTSLQLPNAVQLVCTSRFLIQTPIACLSLSTRGRMSSSPTRISGFFIQAVSART